MLFITLIICLQPTIFRISVQPVKWN